MHYTVKSELQMDNLKSGLFISNEHLIFLMVRRVHLRFERCLFVASKLPHFAETCCIVSIFVQSYVPNISNIESTKTIMARVLVAYTKYRKKPQIKQNLHFYMLVGKSYKHHI